MPRLLLVPVLLLLLFAGTAVQATPLGPAPAVTASFVPFSGGTSEPSIDVTPDGRVFVTSIFGIGDPRQTRSPIWEMVGPGQWQARAGLTRLGEIGGGDADIEFDSRGRGYHTDLWLGNDGMSVSEDLINWTGAPLSHYVMGTDRQWLAHYRDQHLYTVTNSLAAGAVVFRADIGTPAGHLGAFVAVQETPLPCRCGPPGFPAVDQNTGTLYVPMTVSNAALAVYKSTNNGLTFTSQLVNNQGSSSNLFPVAAVDEAGNVYVAFSQNRGGVYNVYLAVQTVGASTWTVHRVSPTTGTHLFPWISAGESGKIAITWYGTDVSGNPNSMPAGTQWRVYYAESLNANAPAPSFATWDLVGVVHHGQVSTQGLQPLGGPDRSLGDFQSNALDPTTGKVYVAFVRNDPSTPANQRGVWVSEMPAGATPLT